MFPIIQLFFIHILQNKINSFVTKNIGLATLRHKSNASLFNLHILIRVVEPPVMSP